MCIASSQLNITLSFCKTHYLNQESMQNLRYPDFHDLCMNCAGMRTFWSTSNLLHSSNVFLPFEQTLQGCYSSQIFWFRFFHDFTLDNFILPGFAPCLRWKIWLNMHSSYTITIIEALGISMIGSLYFTGEFSCCFSVYDGPFYRSQLAKPHF